MLLIFGFRTLWKTIMRGRFQCPAEHTECDYELQEAWRFFALFFIPIIPAGKVGRAVRCSSCRQRFNEDVLTVPTISTARNELAETVRVAAVAMVAADPEGGPLSRERAVAVIGNGGLSATYTDHSLSDDLRLLPVHGIRSIASGIASRLDSLSKERIVRDIADIALANSPTMTAAERRVLDELGAGLGMTPAHLAGVLATAPPA